ncbi:retrovirus poly protein [Rutstroemia sp. NJR-2017a BBW]|nr:retrovirus poly protein [Rutstroemia sp. NJR-2017a BBW]
MQLPWSLALNGRTFKSSALIDTGANGFAFFDSILIRTLSPLFNLSFQRLPRSIPVTGYDSKKNTPIVEYVLLTMRIDQRQQLNIPFLILPLGNQEVILGCRIRHQSGLRPAKIGVANTLPPFSSIHSMSDLRVRKPSKHFQKDVNAHNAAYRLEDLRRSQSRLTCIPTPAATVSPLLPLDHTSPIPLGRWSTSY